MDHRLKAAVRAYQQKNLAKAARELESFANEPTFVAAVSRAGRAERFNGKHWVRCDHQRRLPGDALELGRKRLLAASLAGSTSFHDLFLAVDAAIGEIHKIGELMVYDTALRIGQHLGLEPDRVYLHSGTRVGARALRLDYCGRWLERQQLPAELRQLPPWQVEDILCIYKGWFTGARRLPARCR